MKIDIVENLKGRNHRYRGSKLPPHYAYRAELAATPSADSQEARTGPGPGSISRGHIKQRNWRSGSVHHYVNALNAHVNQDEVPLIRSSSGVDFILGFLVLLGPAPPQTPQNATRELLRKCGSMGGKEFSGLRWNLYLKHYLF